MNKLIFKDEALEKKLRQDGFAVVLLLTSEDIETLKNLYKQHYPHDNEVVFNSFARTADVRALISDGIKQIFSERLSAYFGGFIVTMGIFFIKNKAQDNHIGIHQDPTLLKNEQQEEHINFWCPLQDVNYQNGAMQVFRGSHLYFPPVQALTIPTPYGEHSDLVYAQMETIDMRAGEVLVFDNRLIHSSTANVTDQKRLCVVSSIIPENAEWYSFYRNPQQPDAPIEVYLQQPGCYLHPDWTNNMNTPGTGKKIGLLNYTPFKVSKEELESIIKNRTPAATYKFEVIPA